MKKTVLLAIAVLILWLFLAIIWFAPIYLVPASSSFSEASQKLSLLRNEHRRTIAQILGGLVLLTGVYLTYRRVSILEKNVDIAKEGQLTERFTNAVEQLGSDKLEVRLGGIYALERIARDSQRDHIVVMEVLTSFIRENSYKENLSSISDGEPTADIISAMRVIGRRSHLNWELSEDVELNVYRANLRKTYLPKANFQNIGFYECDFRSARLFGCDFYKARLSRANLEGADLRNTRFENAYLTNVNLKNADLTGADLIGARNLTIEQLTMVKSLYLTSLRPEHMADVARHHQHLLENPKMKKA